MGILDDISTAAYDLERGLLGELTPVSRNFTIVRDNKPLDNCVSIYRVFSYETCVAYVSKRFDDSLSVFVKRDAFHHTVTTSKHVRRFLSALVGRFDFDALYKACNKACDDETINGYSNPWINVREVAQ
mgnify:CR=1 FL=1|jgi:hypothetical protein